MMNGIIKKLNEKGFGFITPEEGDKDIFFHSSDLQGIEFNALHEGDKVTFEQQASEKGPRATNVTVVVDEAVAA
ncbi:MAG: cold-shock protein [Candidatus Peregrinibacteria bacterium]